MKIPLNLVYLKYFCDAVRCGGASAAARMNFVSQSAVSQGISKLEKSIGVALLSHQPNRFRLTYEGERLFEEAGKIFRSIEATEESLLEEIGESRGQLNFACTHSFALALLPRFLKRYRKLRPHVQVRFQLAHTDVIRDCLAKGMIDFGIVIDNEDFSSFQQDELYGGVYQFFRRRGVDGDLPRITSEERREVLQLKRYYRETHGEDLSVALEVSSWEVIANLVEQGLGAGFIPDYVAAKRATLEPEELDLPPISYRLLAIYPQKVPLSQSARAFLDLFSQ